jgi:hypothetical protein
MYDIVVVSTTMRLLTTARNAGPYERATVERGALHRIDGRRSTWRCEPCSQGVHRYLRTAVAAEVGPRSR